MAITYWGIKMIFWFKAKDGVLSMSLLVIWFVSAMALGLLIFSEGISFKERSVSREKMPIQSSADTLYIVGKNKISDIKSDNMRSFVAGNHFYMFIDNEKRELYVSPTLVIKRNDDEPESITIEKWAHGINGTAAFAKAQKLEYDCQIVGDTIYIDNYFTFTSDRKWTGEEVRVSINIGKDKTIKVEKSIDKLLNVRMRGNGKK